eukprot:1306213-Pyramimonas_sp.AAC.1
MSSNVTDFVSNTSSMTVCRSRVGPQRSVKTAPVAHRDFVGPLVNGGQPPVVMRGILGARAGFRRIGAGATSPGACHLELVPHEISEAATGCLSKHE